MESEEGRSKVVLPSLLDVCISPNQLHVGIEARLRGVMVAFHSDHLQILISPVQMVGLRSAPDYFDCRPPCVLRAQGCPPCSLLMVIGQFRGLSAPRLIPFASPIILLLKCSYFRASKFGTAGVCHTKVIVFQNNYFY